MDHLANTILQCRLFESMNVVIRHYCVKTSVMFSRLLQLDVMHSLSQIQVGMSTHSSSLNFCKRKEKKGQQNLKCHNTNGSTDGSGVQMELECKWNSNFE